MVSALIQALVVRVVVNASSLATSTWNFELQMEGVDGEGTKVRAPPQGELVARPGPDMKSRRPARAARIVDFAMHDAIDISVVCGIIVIDVHHGIAAVLATASYRAEGKVSGRRVTVDTLLGNQEHARLREAAHHFVGCVRAVVMEGRWPTGLAGSGPLLEHLALQVLKFS